jgi:hypothetical protein
VDAELRVGSSADRRPVAQLTDEAAVRVVQRPCEEPPGSTVVRGGLAARVPPLR